jgi:hypothetical protein
MSASSRVVFPASNAGSVAHQLASQAADADGAGLVEVLKILLKRAEQIRTINESAADVGPGLVSGEPAPEPPEAGVCLVEDIYRPLCLKLFLACALTALAEQLKSQLKQRNLLRQVKQAVFSEDGDLESLDLNEPEKAPL